MFTSHLKVFSYIGYIKFSGFSCFYTIIFAKNVQKSEFLHVIMQQDYKWQYNSGIRLIFIIKLKLMNSVTRPLHI